MRDRFIQEGRVAVLYSPDWGAGWSTWNTQYEEDLIYEPAIVEMILMVDSDTDDWVSKATMYLTLKYPDMYIGDLTQLRIYWVPEGKEFRIVEHDGNESVEVADEQFWYTA